MEANAHLYVDGAEVAHGPLQAGPIQPQMMMAPVESPCLEGFCATLRWTHRTFFAKSRSTVRASHHIPCRAETGLPSDCV